MKDTTTDLRTRNHIDSAGVRVGYRFGHWKWTESPKIIEKTVVVPAPAPEPTPAPKPDIDTRDTIQLPLVVKLMKENV